MSWARPLWASRLRDSPGTRAESPASAHSPKGSLYLTPASSLSFPLPLNFSAVTCAKFYLVLNQKRNTCPHQDCRARGQSSAPEQRTGPDSRSPNVCSPAPGPTHRPWRPHLLQEHVASLLQQAVDHDGRCSRTVFVGVSQPLKHGQQEADELLRREALRDDLGGWFCQKN